MYRVEVETRLNLKSEECEKLNSDVQFLERKLEKKEDKIADIKVMVGEKQLKIRELERKMEEMRKENEHLWEHQGVGIISFSSSFG